LMIWRVELGTRIRSVSTKIFATSKKTKTCKRL
jgi:hypothetical protein